MDSKEPAIKQHISSGRLFWIWATIGTQSFGGGSATVYLIQRMVGAMLIGASRRVPVFLVLLLAGLVGVAVA